jgi:hypothetical protein
VPHRNTRWGDVDPGALPRSQHEPKGRNRTPLRDAQFVEHVGLLFRAGHAAGRASAVWVAVFVALLTVIAVIYYLIRVRGHPEEETRPPQ